MQQEKAGFQIMTYIRENLKPIIPQIELAIKISSLTPELDRFARQRLKRSKYSSLCINNFDFIKNFDKLDPVEFELQWSIFKSELEKVRG